MGEFFVIYLSVFFSNLIFLGFQSFISDQWLSLKILLIAFICQTCLYYNDLYDLKVTDSFSELSIRLLQALGATAIILAGVYTVFPPASVGLRVFVVSIGFDIVFIVSWRFVYTLILNRKWFDQKIVLFGSNEFSRNILSEIRDRKDCGYVISGVILEGDAEQDSRMQSMLGKNNGAMVVGYKNQVGLCDMVKGLEIRKIIVAIEERQQSFPVKELLKCRVHGIEILEGNSFYEMLTGKLIVDHIRPEWLIFSDGFKTSRSRQLLKRLIDVTLSFAMLIILLPLILITAILIKLDRKKPDVDPIDVWRYFAKICAEKQISVGDKVCHLMQTWLSEAEGAHKAGIWHRFREKCAEQGGDVAPQLLELIQKYIDDREPASGTGNPVFFSQERMGKEGRVYKVHKFRSMVVDAEKYSGPIWAGENDRRITRIGLFIRKWRIDELPQLWNVLNGEMSFVGPRPEREHFVRQLERKIPYYMERLTVKPGLTGWAQVSYGYGASDDDAKEKLNYDLFYIKNMTILMDLMIVLRTVKIVLFGKGR
ncbi:sugar transferase [Desulfonema ishimotonii]|nr:sugar transferase [Desulfonema ishimotonii]